MREEMNPRTPGPGATGENANWTNHKPKSAEASHQASFIFTRNNIPINDCPRVISNSSSCWSSKEMELILPRLQEYTSGSIAVSSVHWLILLDTMFISAMEALSTVRAQ